MTQNQDHDFKRIFRSAPFVADLGIEAVSLGDGVCQAQLELLERHNQQNGYVHAGVQATLADHCAGAAASTVCPPGHFVLAAEFKIHLLRPARGEKLECIARVLKPGRTLSIVESEVYCHSEAGRKLVAKYIATMANVPKHGQG